jgi:hypothetical protein
MDALLGYWREHRQEYDLDWFCLHLFGALFYLAYLRGLRIAKLIHAVTNHAGSSTLMLVPLFGRDCTARAPPIS